MPMNAAVTAQAKAYPNYLLFVSFAANPFHALDHSRVRLACASSHRGYRQWGGVGVDECKGRGLQEAFYN